MLQNNAADTMIPELTALGFKPTGNIFNRYNREFIFNNSI